MSQQQIGMYVHSPVSGCKKDHSMGYQCDIDNLFTEIQAIDLLTPPVHTSELCSGPVTP